MNYHILREIADSWVLLAMFLFFAGAILWSFRPGSRVAHLESATSIFRNDDHPADHPADQEEASR